MEDGGGGESVVEDGGGVEGVEGGDPGNISSDDSEVVVP